MTTNERINEDMRKLFADRLFNVINDIMQTCEIAEVEGRDAVVILITEMMHRVVGISKMMDMPKDQFLHMCDLAYSDTEMVKKTRTRR